MCRVMARRISIPVVGVKVIHDLIQIIIQSSKACLTFSARSSKENGFCMK